MTPAGVGARGLLVAMLALGAGAPAADLARAPAELMPRAARSLLLAAAAEGDRLIAVGERGHVLLSEDGGRRWRQVPAPTRSTLTAVTLLPGGLAWAAGHDGVVLHSADGGRSWVLQHAAPEDQRPLLAVWFDGPERGLVAGAYGGLLRMQGGGRAWADDLIHPDEPHVNAIAEAPSGALYAAGEFGMLFRSEDLGLTWRPLESPYDGTWFGALALSGGAVLVYGLRGRVFRSEDEGASWSEIAAGTTAMLMAGIELADRRVVLGGARGTLLVSHDQGRSFEMFQDADRLGIADLVELDGGALLLVGEGGLRRVEGPGAPAAAVGLETGPVP